MRADDEKTQDFRIIILQHITNRKEIAERFRHFFIIHPYETVMHPVIDERMAGSAFRLGDLIFMMRELKIGTAPVNIKMIPQKLARHGRAFNMPSGTAGSPFGRPFGFIRFGRLCRLPQHKIQWIPFAGIDIDPFTGPQVIK